MSIIATLHCVRYICTGEVMEAETEAVQRVSTRQWVESKEYNPEQVFDKVGLIFFFTFFVIFNVLF